MVAFQLKEILKKLFTKIEKHQRSHELKKDGED